MAKAVLTISSKNYSSWSLRGWLLCRLAGLDVEEQRQSIDDPGARAELLLLSPSFLTPALEHKGIHVWDTLAIAEYLHEVFPKAGLFPADRAARTHNRSISGEMHSGFIQFALSLANEHEGGLSQFPGLDWRQARYRARLRHLARLREPLWRPLPVRRKPTVADAMFAPVCSRFATYNVQLDEQCVAFRDHILGWAPMVEWAEAAKVEPDEMEELDVEF